VIRHLLKLVWRRKRSTGLLMLEVAISFLVVFGVAAAALRLLYNWRRPLGFDWRDVWVVVVDTNSRGDDTWLAQQTVQMAQLEREAARLPRVVAAAGTLIVPYNLGGEDTDIHYGDRGPITSMDEVTDGFAAVMGLRLVGGRWFGPADDGATVGPVVINRHLARELFGDEDPLGKIFTRGTRRHRVVGMIDDFRQDGELADTRNYMFTRIVPDPQVRPAQHLLLRMAPGTRADYEQAILSRLAPVATGWSLSIEPLSGVRHGRFRFQLAPLIVGAVVASFLLLMVALGLLGVLWQNVTRRTRELGLRRAAGASRAAVHRQVLLELLIVTTLAVLPALALVLQLPLVVPIAPAVLAEAIAVGLLVVYTLGALCGLYPSRFATRLPPAEALRWE
jgi:putative ABC transport system permease protein